MTPHPMKPRRRHFLAAVSLSALLAACGGGSTDTPADGPAIQAFGSAAATHFVGDRARLTATFSGGTGRVEPGIGNVTSGVPFDTPVLDSTRRYTLVVQAPGRPAARRDLDLPVAFRDRYQTLPTPFAVHCLADRTQRHHRADRPEPPWWRTGRAGRGRDAGRLRLSAAPRPPSRPVVRWQAGSG